MLEELRRQMAALMERRSAIQVELTGITDTAESEERSELTETEEARWAELRTEVSTLDADAEKIAARVADLEALDAAEVRAQQVAATVGAPATGSPVRVGHEPRTYSAENPRRSFFADAFATRYGYAPDAQERLAAHGREVRALGEDVEQRDVGTDALGALVVPQYLVDMFAPNVFAGRPTANVVRSVPLPAEGMTIAIPRGTTKPATGEQTTQNTAVTEQDFDETTLNVPVVTIAGQQDMSRQAIERAAGTDQIIYSDLVEDYAAKLDAYVLAKASVGLTVLAGTNAVTYTDASPTVAEIWPKLVDAVTQINTNRLLPATVCVMHPRRWGWLWAAQDSSGRPLFVGDAPTNPMGTGTAAEYGQVVGSLNGLVPVVTDANMPTNLGAGTNQDSIVFLRASDSLLFEETGGLPRRLRFEETLGGSLTVKLVVYGYAAFTAGRYPSAISVVNGTGLVTPTF